MNALLQIGLPVDGYPLWLVILLALLVGIAGFWEKIKSTVELKISGSQKKAEREFRSFESENETLKKRIIELEIKHRNDRELLEKKITRLMLSETKLSTIAMFLLNEYEKSNPDNQEMIERMKAMTNSVLNGHD